MQLLEETEIFYSIKAFLKIVTDAKIGLIYRKAPIIIFIYLF